MATCGEVLVELLESAGIDTVFGIPGVHTVELYRGLERTQIRHITPRHEQGAGFMADGFYRASGRVAACFIITGPGLTNIATALGQAYADSIPMLIISSVNNKRELGLGEGRLHELPSQRNLMSNFTAFSHTLLDPRELPQVLARAFAVFNSARPRPVHIEIPLDVIRANADSLPRSIKLLSARPGPDPQAIAQAVAALTQAKRPLVVLGGGTVRSPAAANALADALGAPVVLTINAKGVLAPKHPLLIGSTLPLAPVLQELAEADVVLAIGTELGETDTLLFDGELTLNGTLVRVDIDPEQLLRNHPADIGIVSDAGLAMQAVADALHAINFKNDSYSRISNLQEAGFSCLDKPTQQHARILQAMREALPDAVIAGDSTQLVYSGNLVDATPQARCWFNASTGYGTLGYALPTALGAKLAMPDSPVMAIIGDGGIQFTIAELATAVELRLPVAIVLWNNYGYFEIKKYMLAREIPTIGVDIYTPDFITIAKGFGCRTASPSSLADLQAVLRVAHHADGPTVIEIKEAQAMTW